MTKLNFLKVVSGTALATAVSLLVPGFAQSSLAELTEAEQQTIVAELNRHRADAQGINSAIQPLEWDRSLSNVAQNWATLFSE